MPTPSLRPETIPDLRDSAQRETQTLREKLLARGSDTWHAEKVGRGYGRRVLVLGGTGYVGEALVRELIERGYRPVVVARSEAAASRLGGPEVLVGDVTRREDMTRVFALARAEVAITLLASRKPNDEEQCYQVDYVANLNAIEAARDAGVKQFIHVSDTGVYSPELFTQFHKLRIEGELLSGRHAPLAFTIVRPTAYFPYLSVHFETVRNGGGYPLMGHGEYALYNPIAREDLAEFITNLILVPAHFGRIHPVGGPWTADNLTTLKGAGEMMFEVLGLPPSWKSGSLAGWDLRTSMMKGMGTVVPMFKRIGFYLDAAKYWSVTTHVAPAYGTRTLKGYFERLKGMQREKPSTFAQRMFKGTAMIPTDV